MRIPTYLQSITLDLVLWQDGKVCDRDLIWVNYLQIHALSKG
ncbi:hypothetical protein ABN584_14620 [Gloeocapsa sp. BRSZ]